MRSRIRLISPDTFDSALSDLESARKAYPNQHRCVACAKNPVAYHLRTHLRVNRRTRYNNARPLRRIVFNEFNEVIGCMSCLLRRKVTFALTIR